MCLTYRSMWLITLGLKGHYSLPDVSFWNICTASVILILDPQTKRPAIRWPSHCTKFLAMLTFKGVFIRRSQRCLGSSRTLIQWSIIYLNACRIFRRSSKKQWGYMLLSIMEFTRLGTITSFPYLDQLTLRRVRLSTPWQYGKGSASYVSVLRLTTPKDWLIV